MMRFRGRTFSLPAALLSLALLGAAVPAAADGGHGGGDEEKAAAPLTPAPAKTGYEGRVVVGEGEVVEGAFVYAYRGYEEILAHTPLVIAGPTADDGSFVMDMPSLGSYYLVAKKRAAGREDGPLAVGDYFSFHGSNPVTVVPGAYTHVGFAMSQKSEEASTRDSDDPGSATLMGQVTYLGEPLEGARVKLYLLTEGDFRGQGYSSAPPTGKSGRFRVDFLPDATYYVLARKRVGGSAAGPLTDGDYFGYYFDNPIHVKNGKITTIRIEMQSKSGEIGKEDSLFREMGTKISGRITDTAGKVVKGTYAFAYEEKVMAHKRPSFISREVDAEGRYVIQVDQGRVYYIGARSAYGDSPGMGEWYGRYDVTPDHSVKVKTGEHVEGIDIVIEQILP